MKPWLKILIVAVVVGLIGLGVYFVFRPQPLVVEEPLPGSELPTGQLPDGGNTGGSDSQNDNEPLPPGGGAATSPKQTLSVISDREVVEFWTNGENIYYLDQTGKIYRARDNEDEEISSQALNGPLNYLESDLRGDLVLFSFGSPLNPTWTIFDSRDAAYRPLSQDIKYATWSNKTGELVAIKELAGGIKQLVYLETDKLAAAPKIILSNFQMESVRLTAAGGEDFLIQELPDSEYAGRIWRLNTKTQTLNLLRDSATNQMVKRGSPEIFFSWSGANGFEINKNSNLTDQFPVPFSTLPQKCGADSYQGFCFVPQELGEDVLAKFLKNEVFFKDSLYSFNVLTEDLENINLNGLSEVPIDGKTPRLAGGSLVFLNRLDKKIYRLTEFR